MRNHQCRNTSMQRRHWQTYNSGIKWDEGEIDGLASETATEFLIKQRQLAYRAPIASNAGLDVHIHPEEGHTYFLSILLIGIQVVPVVAECAEKESPLIYKSYV